MESWTRRQLLLGSGMLAAGSLAESASAEPTETNRLKVLVAGGHPGDPEAGCGGIIARFQKADMM